MSPAIALSDPREAFAPVGPEYFFVGSRVPFGPTSKQGAPREGLKAQPKPPTLMLCNGYESTHAEVDGCIRNLASAEALIDIGAFSTKRARDQKGQFNAQGIVS